MKKMEQYKKDFIEFMIDCQVLKFGDFVTKSGRKTPFFVNTGFYRTGAQLRKLGEYYGNVLTYRLQLKLKKNTTIMYATLTTLLFCQLKT